MRNNVKDAAKVSLLSALMALVSLAPWPSVSMAGFCGLFACSGYAFAMVVHRKRISAEWFALAKEWQQTIDRLRAIENAPCALCKGGGWVESLPGGPCDCVAGKRTPPPTPIDSKRVN